MLFNQYHTKKPSWRGGWSGNFCGFLIKFFLSIREIRKKVSTNLLNITYYFAILFYYFIILFSYQFFNLLVSDVTFQIYLKNEKSVRFSNVSRGSANAVLTKNGFSCFFFLAKKRWDGTVFNKKIITTLQKNDVL